MATATTVQEQQIDVLQIDQMACGRLDGMHVEQAIGAGTRPGYYRPSRFIASVNARPSIGWTWYRVLPDMRVEFYMANWDSSG